MISPPLSTVAAHPPAPDWSHGAYERTADQLLPAAGVLVARASPGPEERVLDVGCGTGSVALLAAARGARVIAIDPAARLLEVGREDAARRRLDVTFASGDAAGLPIGDGEADVVLSSFGLIFADDPGAAAAELARVRSPQGRILFTAWSPDNMLDRAFGPLGAAITRALGDRGVVMPERFAWHDVTALTALFARFGLTPRVEHHELVLTAPSVESYVGEYIETHPLWVSAEPLLEATGERGAIRADIVDAMAAANEDPAAFSITSRYVVVRLDAMPPADQVCAAAPGVVSLPGEPAYETGRLAWNLAVEQLPAAVATPANADDIRRVVIAAARAGLRVAPQSTGHGARAGVALGDAVLLRTDRLDHVEVDPEARRARVGAGARWGAVSDAAEPHRLAALAGSSRDVGVAGYTLGGGVGFLARRHGLACNALTSLQLVATDGRLVRTDATHEPELFWALCGGGGDLGVVTELEFELFDTPELSAGALFWPMAAAAPVLRAWAQWTRELPDELTSIGRLLRVPPAPEIPEALRGRAFVVVELAYLGAPGDLDALLAPLRALDPQLDTVGEVSPTALGWLHMDPDQPIPATDDGFLMANLTDDAIDGLVAVAGAGVDSPLVSVEIRHLGGALGQSAPGAGVTARLPAPYGVFAVGPTPDAATVDHVRNHLRRVRGALEPWCAPANYLHFTTDRDSCFTAEARERLATIKAAWDAGRLITSNEPL